MRERAKHDRGQKHWDAIETIRFASSYETRPEVKFDFKNAHVFSALKERDLRDPSGATMTDIESEWMIRSENYALDLAFAQGIEALAMCADELGVRVSEADIAEAVELVPMNVEMNFDDRNQLVLTLAKGVALRRAFISTRMVRRGTMAMINYLRLIGKYDEIARIAAPTVNDSDLDQILVSSETQELESVLAGKIPAVVHREPGLCGFSSKNELREEMIRRIFARSQTDEHYGSRSITTSRSAT